MSRKLGSSDLKIDTAIVLAGGPATRMKPLTDTVPKGMIKILGKPLLQWIVEWLRAYEIRNIVLGVAHMKDKIIEYFTAGSEFGVNIKYSVHTVEGGTGEGFRLAIERHVSRENFFALNGDQITNLNLRRLEKFHLNHGQIATMVVTNPGCPFGHVRINRSLDVTEFVEKPHCSVAVCNAGIYVFHRDILRYLPKKGDVEKTMFPSLAKTRQLKAYAFKGFFTTVNTLKDLIEAEKELKELSK